MKKYAAILDDDKAFAEILHKKVKALFAKYGLNFDIDVFSNADDLRKNRKTYQLIFMDIILPEGDGVNIVQKWIAEGRIGDVIFVSSDEQQVFRTFECHPIYFVRKTYLEDDLKRAIECYKNRKKPPQVMVPEGSRLHVMNVDDVVYMSSKKHYIDVYKRDGEKILIRGKISDMERIFEGYDFIRVRVNCLVNLRYVAGLESRYIQINTGEKLRISLNYSRELRKKLEAYFAREVEDQ